MKIISCVTSCDQVIDRRFRGTCHLHHQMSDEVCPSEISIRLYQTTLPYIPADRSIYSPYRNNLKFHVPSVLSSLNRTVIYKDNSELFVRVRRKEKGIV
jgi:hypothetical protein